MTDLSQLPKLPWPLCRFVNSAASGAPAGATTGGSAAPAPRSSAAPVEVSVVEDRLRVEGPQLESVLAAIESHLGVQVELVRCERTVKGGLRGFFGREHFVVEARRQGSGTVAPVGTPPVGSPVRSMTAPAPSDPAPVAELADADPSAAPTQAVGPAVGDAQLADATVGTDGTIGTDAAAAPLDGLTFADALARALEELDEAAPVFQALEAEPPVDTVETTASSRRGLQPPRPRDATVEDAAQDTADEEGLHEDLTTHEVPAPLAATTATIADGSSPSVADLLLALLAERAEVLDLREVDHGALDRIADLIAPADAVEPTVTPPAADVSSRDVWAPAETAPAETAPATMAPATAGTWSATPESAPSLPRFGAEPAGTSSRSAVPTAPLLPRLDASPFPPAAAAPVSAAAAPVPAAEPAVTPPVASAPEPEAPAPGSTAHAPIATAAPAPVVDPAPAADSAAAQLRRAAALMPFDDVVAAVRGMVGPVPSLPEQGLVAVMGDEDAALRAAQLLARQAGDDPGDVVVVSPTPVDGRPPWMCVTTVDEVVRRRARWMRRDHLTVVALVLDPDDGECAWGREVLAALAPTQTRLAVPGGCPADQVEHQLRSLSPVHAIDLTGAADVETSISFLDQDVPVASVDGFAATYEAWARWLQSVAPAVRRARTSGPPTPSSEVVDPAATSHLGPAPSAPPPVTTPVPAAAMSPNQVPADPPAAAQPIAPAAALPALQPDAPLPSAPTFEPAAMAPDRPPSRRRPAPSAPSWARPAVATAMPSFASWSRGDPPGALVATGTSHATALLDRPPPDARGPDQGARHGAAPRAPSRTGLRVLPGGRTDRDRRPVAPGSTGRAPDHRTITSPSFPVVESPQRAAEAPEHRNDP